MAAPHSCHHIARTNSATAHIHDPQSERPTTTPKNRARKKARPAINESSHPVQKPRRLILRGARSSAKQAQPKISSQTLKWPKAGQSPPTPQKCWAISTHAPSAMKTQSGRCATKHKTARAPLNGTSCARRLSKPLAAIRQNKYQTSFPPYLALVLRINPHARPSAPYPELAH